MSYRLPDSQIDGVAEAAAAVGDHGFYVVETEAHSRELLGQPPAALPHQLPKDLVDLVEGFPPALVRTTWAAANREPNYSDHEAWWFSLDDLAPFKEPSTFGPVGETALISSSAAWGIIISHEGHAVAGGNARFLETLIARFPSLVAGDKSECFPPSEQVVAFLREVKRSWHEPMEWLPGHLAHVYGEERAAELLRVMVE